MTDSHYSSDRPKIRVRYYRFRNHLKSKASTGFGGGGPGRISAEALERAEAEFEKMAEDYPDWVQGYLKKLTEHLSRCVDTPEDRPENFKKLNALAHDLKGQGGTFGYPLMSHFGDSLFNFTEEREEDIMDNHIEIVKAHIDSMRVVIGQRINGDGGAIGKTLIKELEGVISKNSEIA
jgi:hypothetical protein